MNSIRRESVTIVRQTVLDNKVVAAQTTKVVRNVYRNSVGEEYIVVDKKKVLLIRGVALAGGKTDPDAKPGYK